jgi:hypothetical protein
LERNLLGWQFNCHPNLASPPPLAGGGQAVGAVSGLAGTRVPPSLQFSSGTDVLPQGYSMMLHNKLIVACVVAFAPWLTWTSSASAVVVASYAGPTVLDGIDDTVVLPNVSIGQEGTLSLQFKAHDTAGMHCLWFCADKPADQLTALGEYRLNLTNNNLWFQLYPCDCSTNRADFHFTDTNRDTWHSVSLSWKDGYDTLLALDGVQRRAANINPNTGHAEPLPEFASTTPYNVLGVNPLTSPQSPIRYFDGEMRNVFIYNTYETPEPSVFILTITGLISVLACALWKRR